MALATYRKKRNFRVSPEPAGAKGAARKSRAMKFVVQKHDASHLHYDFRLEMEGVLRSWAVPKGPSIDPSQRALAVQVEDHPLEYGSFEGTIPKGQYGGGTVMIWDKGTWEPAKGTDPVEGFKRGSLKFTLHGDKLHGQWHLVRMKDDADSKRHNWLLIKDADEFAKCGRKNDLRLTHPLSAHTGRDLDEIAAGAKPSITKARGARGSLAPSTRSRPRSRTKKPPRKSPRKTPREHQIGAARHPQPTFGIDPGDLPGAVQRPAPDKVTFQLCQIDSAIPTGDEWLHEIKFDGYRLLARVQNGHARLITRNQLDWSAKFPAIIAGVEAMDVPEAIFDGEVVALNASGLSDFQGLQGSLKSGHTAQLVYFVFDVPYLGGYDLRGCRLLDRYRALESLLQVSAGSTENPHVRLSEHIGGRGSAVIEHACRLGLEGVISKRADSVYSGTRNGDWLKIKCKNKQEFVIGGFSDPRKTRQGFGALLLGHYNAQGELVYAGKVGSGYDEADLNSLSSKLRQIEQTSAAFATVPRIVDNRRSHWVKPKYVAEVEFTQWTRDGLLRHPVFLGLREDKEASQVTRESPSTNTATSSTTRSSRRTTATTNAKLKSPVRATRKATTRSKEPTTIDSTVLGVTITHPDRIVYPDAGVTKLQIARYYASIAEWVLPHLKDRPLSLVRCPQGVGGACFFNKHMDIGSLPGLKEVEIKEKKGVNPYVIVAAPEGLVALTQMNTLELHAWGSRSGDIEHPDRIVFDLDPGEGVKWAQVIESARQTRKLLQQVGLDSFVKTTGGKGLHVVVPLHRRAEWDDIKAFSHAIATQMTVTDPERYTDTLSKQKRQGKILIDYLRNQRGATAIAPFSTRARAGATVSMPITWESLGRIHADQFTIETTPKYLQQRKRDPWAEFATTKQSLNRSLIAAIDASH